MSATRADHFFWAMAKALGLGCIWYSIGLVALQVYTWLNQGCWIPFPVSVVFISEENYLEWYSLPLMVDGGGVNWTKVPTELIRQVVPFCKLSWAWFNDPQEWIGVQRIVSATFNWLSIPVAAFALGCGLFAWVASDKRAYAPSPMVRSRAR